MISQRAAEIVDRDTRQRTTTRFRSAGIRLPKLSELAAPSAAMSSALADVDPDQPDPRNLFRVHWHNGANRRDMVAIPDHTILPPALTGVPAKIIVALGNRFPMIKAHKGRCQSKLS